MEQERVIRLVLRQIKDIQSQADKILSDKADEDIQNFTRYSIELKNFIADRIDDEKINSYLKEIQDVEYTPRFITRRWTFWENIAKSNALEEINTVRGKYAHLELLIKQLT